MWEWLKMIVEVGLRVNDSDSESCDDRLMTKRSILVPSSASDVLKDQSRVGWCNEGPRIDLQFE